jgi:hypothetical protein
MRNHFGAIFAQKCSNLPQHQGDQIGRIFAFWVIVYFGHFKKYTISPNFWATIFHSKKYIF